jgi:hypothetical protein
MQILRDGCYTAPSIPLIILVSTSVYSPSNRAFPIHLHASITSTTKIVHLRCIVLRDTAVFRNLPVITSDDRRHTWLYVTAERFAIFA